MGDVCSKETSAEQGSWQKLGTHQSQALPWRPRVLSSCDPRAVPGMAPALGAEMAHRVPGCARMSPIATFLLLGSFPAMATLPALPVLAEMEQQCYHAVFPLSGCWKKAIVSSWDFSQRCYYLPEELIFHIFSILWNIKVVECCKCSACSSYGNMNILFWKSRLKNFIEDIPSLKNRAMFLKHTYSQPTRNCLSVILLSDDNNINKFCRHKLLCYLCNQTLNSLLTVQSKRWKLTE